MNTITGLSAYTGALQRLQQSLKTADSDGNGSLSLSEFEAAAKTDTALTGGQSASAAFTKLDADHNGAVSTAEITQGINLTSQVQSALIQAQELSSGNMLLQLLGGGSGTDLTSSLLGGSSSLFGGSNDYSSLTSSLLGGASSSSALTSAVTGGNANTAALAGLLGGNNALLQSVLAKYTTAGTETA